MKLRSTIILPVALAAVGIMTVVLGKTGQVAADVTSTGTNSSLYVLLTAAGFLLIVVAAIIALFMIASGEEKKK